MLPLAAAAGLEVLAARRHAQAAGLEDFEEPGLGESLFSLLDACADAVAGHGAGHEHDVAAPLAAGAWDARQALATVGEVGERDLDLATALEVGRDEGAVGLRHGPR